uniref:Uncharacterized protein n=1 Tax=Anguilla anguilla TaxID=7936 RepID=A0A0E9WL73_ANGAN
MAWCFKNDSAQCKQKRTHSFEVLSESLPCGREQLRITAIRIVSVLQLYCQIYHPKYFYLIVFKCGNDFKRVFPPFHIKAMPNTVYIIQ